MLTGIIGNLLKHYDTALYGLLAPTLAPLFFPESDPISALILTYAILPISYLSKPVGSLFFGWIGDSFGRRQALSLSLIGIALASVAIACIPTYSEVGSLSALILTSCRLMQNFCAAAESSGGAIFTLENTQSSKRSLISSIYDASSIAGVLIASILVTYFSENWRLLFALGGICGLWGLFLRIQIKESTEFVACRKNSLRVLLENKHTLVRLALASGFSHTTYAISFTLMNGLLPLISHVSKIEVLQVNSSLLVLDMLALPCFGLLASRHGIEKVMRLCCIGTITVACPLFYLLQGADLATTVLIRSVIVILGVGFAAPYYAWALKITPSETRYTLLSVGSSLGALFIASPASMLCLWLYKITGLTFLSGFYLAFIALLATFAIKERRAYYEQISSPTH